MGNTLGITKEEIHVIVNEEEGSGTLWTTGWLGSRSVPNTPLRPNQQSRTKNSFLELC